MRTRLGGAARECHRVFRVRPATGRPPMGGGRRDARGGHAAMSADVDDELWTEFHRVVNMTSRELEDWLRTRDAGPEAEPLPDQAGTPTGHEVLGILRKRRSDVDTHDTEVMRKVVDRVHAQRRDDLEPT